jgi:hypothetical protein
MDKIKPEIQHANPTAGTTPQQQTIPNAATRSVNGTQDYPQWDPFQYWNAWNPAMTNGNWQWQTWPQNAGYDYNSYNGQYANYSYPYYCDGSEGYGNNQTGWNEQQQSTEQDMEIDDDDNQTATAVTDQDGDKLKTLIRPNPAQVAPVIPKIPIVAPVMQPYLQSLSMAYPQIATTHPWGAKIVQPKKKPIHHKNALLLGEKLHNLMQKQLIIV